MESDIHPPSEGGETSRAGASAETENVQAQPPDEKAPSHSEEAAEAIRKGGTAGSISTASDGVSREISGETAHPSQELNWSSKIMLSYAVGFGAGYSPKAPGTAGTLVGVLIYLAIARLHPAIQILTVLTLTLLAVHAARIAGRYFGNSDDQHIVSDEIAGYLITMLLVPADPVKIAAGFVFFRTFDILKPWPCSYFDKKMKNAAGNVMDDVCAGIFGRILMLFWVLLW